MRKVGARHLVLVIPLSTSVAYARGFLELGLERPAGTPFQPTEPHPEQVKK